MRELRKYRPGPIKSILGALRARGWTYEMRLGMDGTLTGGPMYGDVYAHIWELHLAGHHDEAAGCLQDDGFTARRLHLLARGSRAD